MPFTFKPRPFTTILAALLIGLFIWLGFWQLDRAAFKEKLFARMENASESEAVPISGVSGLDDLKPYTRVRVRGHYGPHQIDLGNRIHDGKVGVHVYTPLHVGDGVILVNRGWVVMRDRQNPPEVPVPDGPVTVTGITSPPPATGIVLGEVTVPEHWPWLTPYLLMDKVRAAYERPVADQVLLLAPTAPHGFVREWEPDTMPPARHIGYAFQWFALAAAVLAAWIGVNARRKNGAEAG